MVEQQVSRSEANWDLDDSRVRRWGRRALITAGVTVTAGLAVVSGLFINGNVDDFMDLKDFTSPAHQEDRQNVQAAVDAQDKMYEHFRAKGGVTDDEAAAMSAFTGLSPEEISAIVSKKLYPMDYDGDTPEASSSKVTKGIAAGSLATGLTVGATIAGIYSRLKPRRKAA